MNRRQALVRLLAGVCLAGTLPLPLQGAERTALPSESFVEGVEDLPLMPGLANVEAAGVAFDTTEGRIIVAYASGQVTREAVITFYADTLPQLGWKRERDQRYRRDKEALTLEFSRTAGGLTVRFSLSPIKP
jgi:hypothetical protein